MAKFDPPQQHWDDDFDRRLASTFEWLREQVTDAQERVRVLEQLDRDRSAQLAQAVADAQFWANQAKGK